MAEPKKKQPEPTPALPSDEKLNRRAKYTIEMLLPPIKGPNPCGISLRHEPIYDQIREARREDDETVSRGVWQFELKRADWSEVETLAGEALLSQSKDLQIAGWIGESWVEIGGLAGIHRSLLLIHGLCEKYWDCLYPEIEDGDIEYRSQFFDWYDQNLAERFVSLPVAEEEFVDYPFTLADWMSAVHFETAIKRNSDPAKMLQKAESKGQPILRRLQSLLKQVPSNAIQDKINFLQTISQEFQSFMDSLNALMPKSTVAFNQFKPALDEMTRVYKAELAKRPVPIDHPLSESTESSADDVSEEMEIPVAHPLEGPPPTENEASATQGLTREKAYNQLSDIADFFQQTDPHNPATQILKRLIDWQNKSLMDIFTEMGSSPEELVAFMKFMGVTGQKE